MRRSAGGTATESGDLGTEFIVEKCVAVNSLDHRRLQARANQMQVRSTFTPYTPYSVSMYGVCIRSMQ